MVLSKQQSDDLAGISTIEDSAMPEDIHISSTRLSTKNAACQTDLIISVINSRYHRQHKKSKNLYHPFVRLL